MNQEDSRLGAPDAGPDPNANADAQEHEPWDEEAGGGRTIAMSAPVFDSTIPSPISVPPPPEPAPEALLAAKVPASAPVSASAPASDPLKPTSGLRPEAVIKRTASSPDGDAKGALFTRTEPAGFTPPASKPTGAAPATAAKLSPPRASVTAAGAVKAPAPAAKVPGPRTAPYAFSPGPKVEGPSVAKAAPAVPAAPATVPSFGDEDGEDKPTMAMDQASLAPVATQSADRLQAVPGHARAGEREEPTRVASSPFHAPVGHGADGESSTLTAPPGGVLASPGIVPGFAETLADDRPTSMGSRAALANKGNLDPLPGYTPGVFAWGRPPSGAIDPNISGEEFAVAPVPMSGQSYGGPAPLPQAYGAPQAPYGYPNQAPMGAPPGYGQQPMMPPPGYGQVQQQGYPQASYPAAQHPQAWGGPNAGPPGQPQVWGQAPVIAPARSKTQTLLLVGLVTFSLLMFIGGVILFAVARL